MFKGMFFDISNIEIREKYGHIEEESEDEDEHGEVVEQVGHHCGKCLFIVKTEARLKSHLTVKHKIHSVRSRE